jgi:phosphate starvation-inducible protein PhoH
VLDNMPSVYHIEFNVEDIVRSGLVKEFIIAESEFR